jgi:twitching motility protein PilT
MARIDRFLEALIQRGADQVKLATGERAMLVFAGEARPVTSSCLGGKLLEKFVQEIVPAELAGDVAQAGSHQFQYAIAGRSVLVSVVRDGEGLTVDACLTEEQSAPARETPPSQPIPSAPPAEAAHTAPATAAVRAAPAASSARAAASAAPVAAADTSLDGVVSGPATEAMDALFREMVEQGCSDLHLSSGCPPLFRKDGGMVSLSSVDPLDAGTVRDMLLSITPGGRRVEFSEHNDSDFSYEIEGLGRFRCNLFMDRKGMGGVFRVIPDEILTVEDLKLSEHILKLCHLSKGLVVVTGPTGSGKSTTLAAMIDYINRERSAHIITIEDPIEFVHDNKQCLINQREIGNHTDGFKAALRAALREDPDIVLVGEMRDLETVEIALETAETGHLVFGTLHTNTAASTVDRIIDQFPSDRQGQVRTMLSGSLKGVIAQTLCKKVGGGRCAALEVLIVNAAVSNLIREGKTFQIGSIMQTGKKLGMGLLNDALAKLVDDGLVEPLEAWTKAVDRANFANLLSTRGIQLDVELDAD